MKTPTTVLLVMVFLGRTATLAAPAPAQSMPDQLDLPTAISFALENNFAIRQARERIRQQEGVVTTVSATGLPNVSGTGSYRKSDVPAIQSAAGQVPVFLPAGRSWRLNLIATQTLYAGGGVRASTAVAELGREAAILDFKATVNEALLGVRVGFYNVLLAREQIEVQERNVELLRSQLQDTTARFDTGTTSAFEKLRAEVAVANAQVPLIQARNEFRLAVEDLRHVLGFTTNEPETARKVPEFIGSLTLEPVNFELEAAFEAARTNRPDLQRLAKLVAAGAEGVTVARARYQPSLRVRGGYELRKGPTERFSDSLDGFLLGAQSRWEIQNRATTGRVVQADAQLEILRLTESEARLGVEVDVRRAFSSLQQATELTSAAQKTVEQADEAVRLVTARYNVGAATQLDVLRSQVELTTARTTRIRASHGYNVAVAQLRKAIGTAEIDYRDIPNSGGLPGARREGAPNSTPALGSTTPAANP